MPTYFLTFSAFSIVTFKSSWFASTLSPSSRSSVKVGCERSSAGLRCEQALNVVLYCNGPNCGQSPTAMAAMVEAGFPASKIFYYRGGMLAWTSLGLTTRENEHLNLD